MRRRILIAVPTVIVLFAGLAVLSSAAGRAGGQPMQRNHFRTHELSFAYPASWRRTECRREESEGPGTSTIAYLGSASSPPRCTAPGWLHQRRLSRGGVIVMWGYYAAPRASSLRRFPGRRLRVGGQPARIAIQPAGEGCAKIAGTRRIDVMIRFPQTAGNWWTMTACMRGRHLSAREAQIHRMLASVKLKGPTLRLGVCGTPSTRVGRIVPDHGTVRVGSGGRTVGGLVSVRLHEPAKYLTGAYPHSFPWRIASSSNPELLDPRSFCHPRGKLSVEITNFFSPRSPNAGRTHLRAALSPAWRALPPSVRRGIAPYTGTVILTGRSHRRPASRR